MKKHIYKFETIFWIIVKVVLYFLAVFVFIKVLGQGNIGLTRLSRTLGITVSTYVVVGLLFLSVYGKYDVGRRKSKPIIYSLVLAMACTDIVVYLQVMIMNTNSPDVHSFHLTSLSLLLIAFVIQIVVVILFTYAGNWLFFQIHEPEKCCVITSSQESLDEIVYAIKKFKKQYFISSVLDYQSDQVKQQIKEADTVFVYDVPVEARTDIMRWSYKYKVNVYFNPEIEDIMELNAKQYILDDLYLLNRNVKALTMEQRIMKRLLDIILSHRKSSVPMTLPE